MFRRGKGRIRTDGPLLTIGGFQDLCNNPLCHFSKICSGRRSRTSDLKVMSLASYHCSTPQYIFVPKERFELPTEKLENSCSSVWTIWALCGKWDSNSRYFCLEDRCHNQLGDYRILKLFGRKLLKPASDQRPNWSWGFMTL